MAAGEGAAAAEPGAANEQVAQSAVVWVGGNGGSDSLSRQLLEHSLRALVNLTHGSVPGCEAVVRQGLPVIARVVATELEGTEERNGLAKHYDTAMMAIGLLTNCLEVCPHAASKVGSILCSNADAAKADGSSSEAGAASTSASTSSAPPAAPAATTSLLALLARTLRQLLAPLPPPALRDASDASADAASSSTHAAASSLIETAMEVHERRAMEREVSAAYIALLLGFICKEHPKHARTALTQLCEPSFEKIGKLLRSYACWPPLKRRALANTPRALPRSRLVPPEMTRDIMNQADVRMLT